MNPSTIIWLEVTNVRTEQKSNVQIQVKGDRAEREPAWWNVNADAYIDNAATTYRTLSENLDKKRVVLAALGAVELGADTQRADSQDVGTQGTDTQGTGTRGSEPPKPGTLECKHLRIQYAESASR